MKTSPDLNPIISNRQLTRRDLLRVTLKSLPLLALGGASVTGLAGCTRHRYERPAGELDLGPVHELLYANVHVRSKAILLFRTADGWRALSSRCTYIGCDLTFQEPVLLCPCCRSLFDLEGRVIEGSVAKENLPWVGLDYRKEDGHLIANPGRVVSASTYYTTPEIEEAIRDLRERVKAEGIADEVKIPELLKGEGDQEPGTMFVDEDPNFVHELQMIK